jgi:Xaa-Pro aminopeptidase
MNTERTFNIMNKYQLDALMASSAVNLKYLCNYSGVFHQYIPGVEVYAVLPNIPGAKPTLILPVSETELAVDLLPYVDELVPYGRFIYYVSPGKELCERDGWIRKFAIDSTPIPTALEAVASVLKKLGLDNQRIGIDESNFYPKQYQKFINNIRAAQVVDAYEIFREIKMVKMRGEVEILEQAVRIEETALRKSLTLAAEGVSEKDFQNIFEKTIFENGGTPIFTCIYFGEQSFYGQVLPSPDKRLTAKSIIRYDVGCIYKGYFSDIARTAFFGQPSDKHEECYQTVLEAQEAALNITKPGIKVSELFNVAIEVAKKRIPEYNRTHIGHGIGLELYEPPIIASTTDIILEEGMVFNIETPYYELGLGGFQVEDTVVVTENGFRFLTTLGRNLMKV